LTPAYSLCKRVVLCYNPLQAPAELSPAWVHLFGHIVSQRVFQDAKLAAQYGSKEAPPDFTMRIVLRVIHRAFPVVFQSQRERYGSAKHEHQRSPHLLHRYGDGAIAESLTELSHPGLYRFRLVLQLSAFALRGAVCLQAPHMFLIRPIDTHERRELGAPAAALRFLT